MRQTPSGGAPRPMASKYPMYLFIFTHCALVSFSQVSVASFGRAAVAVLDVAEFSLTR